MNTLTAVASSVGRVTGPLSVEIAFRMFGRVGRPAVVHARDAAVHEAARKSTLRVGGRRIATYSWGSGHDVVLLVHGWHSRASTFSALITTLSRPGRTIVAFDAPGNGESSRGKVTVLDYARVIDALSKKHGPFQAIVAHSFGTLATFLSVNHGVRSARIVSVAGVHSGEQLVETFAAQIGLASRRVPRLKQRLAAGPFHAIPDPWRRLVSELASTDRDIPLLVICDEDDRVVDPGHSERIALAHRGPVVTVATRGLGHSRILRDPTVLANVAEFVDRAHSGPRVPDESRLS